MPGRRPVSATEIRLPRSQSSVEVERRADEGQVGERLREVAQSFAAVAGLFGVEAEVVGVAEHLLEQKASVFEAGGIGATGGGTADDGTLGGSGNWSPERGPKNGIGIAFWIAGVPDSADIVKVDVPTPIAAGIRRRGMSAARKSSWAIGARTKNATNRLTPPNVTSAPASTTARTARCAPSLSLIYWAIAETEPLSSISLPNTAPSRNRGKNCAKKVAAPPMKV